MPVSENGKPRDVTAEIDITSLPPCVVAQSKCLDRCEQLARHLVENFLRHRRIDPDDQPPVFGNEVHQTRELKLDLLQIAVNIGMVELDVVHDRDLGQVVHELRFLIEICRIVLVALDDEMIAVGHAEARLEVLNDPSHKKARVQTAYFADPCGDTRRRSLTVSSGDDERTPSADEFFLNDLGLRAIWQFTVENFLKLGITTRDRVPDDDA